MLKIGDHYQVKIEKIGRKGDGIARFNNYFFLIPDTSEGETIQIEVTKCSANFGFAKVVKKLK